jgi:hypothetical protein
MFKFTKGNTETIICTLLEKQTNEGYNYLFVFTSRVTNSVVKFVLLNNADTSTNRLRWNEFSIIVNNYFANSPEGWWGYDIYEQESSTNTDVSLTGGLLESGLMFLNDSTQTTITKYSQDINFTFYDAG